VELSVWFRVCGGCQRARDGERKSKLGVAKTLVFGTRRNRRGFPLLEIHEASAKVIEEIKKEMET
jgi:hypothetical protein